MSLLGSFLVAFAKVFNMAVQLYIWIVIARALISWVNPDPYNPIVRFLHGVTDPVLDRIRRLVPARFGAFDLSPLLLIFGLYFLQELVNNLVSRMLLG